MSAQHLHKFPQWVGGRRRVNAARRARVLARMEDVWVSHQRGESQASIARRYGVNRSAICRQLRWAQESGWAWRRATRLFTHLIGLPVVRDLMRQTFAEVLIRRE